MAGLQENQEACVWVFSIRRCFPISVFCCGVLYFVTHVM